MAATRAAPAPHYRVLANRHAKKLRWQNLSYWKAQSLVPCQHQSDACQQQQAKMAETHKGRGGGALRMFFVAVRLDWVVNLENHNLVGRRVLFEIKEFDIKGWY